MKTNVQSGQRIQQETKGPGERWTTNVLSLSLQGLMQTQQENGSHTMKYKSKYKEKRTGKEEEIKRWKNKNVSG